LRKLGFNINSKKTTILDKKSENIEEYFPSTDDRITVIDNMWKSRSKKVIAKSIPILHEFLQEQIESKNTQGRPFRFCINRFKTLISSNLFDSKSVLASEIADTIIQEFSIQPVSTDQFCKLLMDIDLSSIHLQSIIDYICDKDKAIYGWQNYHLLLLLAYKKHHSNILIEHCKNKVTEDAYQPEVSACFIYLASVNHEHDVEEFIGIFEETWPYQHQRFFLIALQNSAIETLKPLFGKINYRLKGTVNRLKGNGKFKNSTVFLKDFNETLISELYDEISPYE
jgi:hypothetical protein